METMVSIPLFNPYEVGELGRHQSTSTVADPGLLKNVARGAFMYTCPTFFTLFMKFGDPPKRGREGS